MYCSHCGTANEVDAYSCSRCGERVYAPDVEHPSPLGLVACPKCSAPNESHARYCWKCSASLESGGRFSPQGAAAARAARPGPLTDSRTPPRPPSRRPPVETPRDLRSTLGTENDSGTRNAVLPEELRGWNWGAFLLGFAWAAGNRVWWAAAADALALLVLYFAALPGVLEFAVLVAIRVLLGFKGSEWAWRSREWESTQQFKLVQRMWMNWGTIIVIVVVVLAVMWTRTPVTPDVPTS